MKKLLLFLLFTITGLQVLAQVSLAPTAVFLDKNGIGSLYITNNSETPQEITVNFQFGYSSQDSKGILIMVYDDSAKARANGLQGMIKAFPRTFILPPKQQQLVRIQARTPKGLTPGTYFTRLKVGSTSQLPDIGTQGEGVNTRVNIRFEQVIAAFYKYGAVSTSVVVEGIETFTDSNFLALKYNYKSGGNSPYLGKVKTIIRKADGTVIAENSQTVALYYNGMRQINFRLPEIPKQGRYELEMRFETQRSDITPEDLVQAPPYVYKTYLQLP